MKGTNEHSKVQPFFRRRMWDVAEICGHNTSPPSRIPKSTRARISIAEQPFCKVASERIITNIPDVFSFGFGLKTRYAPKVAMFTSSLSPQQPGPCHQADSSAPSWVDRHRKRPLELHAVSSDPPIRLARHSIASGAETWHQQEREGQRMGWKTRFDSQQVGFPGLRTRTLT